MMKTIKCLKCNASKEVIEFYYDIFKQKYTPICRECMSQTNSTHDDQEKNTWQYKPDNPA